MCNVVVKYKFKIVGNIEISDENVKMLNISRLFAQMSKLSNRLLYFEKS